jgi:hypothetical protein
LIQLKLNNMRKNVKLINKFKKTMKEDKKKKIKY